jgi:tRNA 2-thiouridine synthesizing protein A
MGLFGSRNNKAASEGPVGKVTLSNGETYEIAGRVDCLGDNCPRPQLMTRKALQAAAQNDVIEVLVDNPSSMEAIPPMMPGLNATHLETVKGDRRWEIYVRKD